MRGQSRIVTPVCPKFTSSVCLSLCVWKNGHQLAERTVGLSDLAGQWQCEVIDNDLVLAIFEFRQWQNNALDRSMRAVS